VGRKNNPGVGLFWATGFLLQGWVSPGGISRAADWERWAVSLKRRQKENGEKRKDFRVSSGVSVG
jgi:hypothetical protein